MTWLGRDLEERFLPEAERDLAREIATRTGVLPVVTTSFDKGTRHREPMTYRVLRFWMRDRDGMIISRDIDLREFHPKEGVKHALRAVVRTARLDHVGLPIGVPVPDTIDPLLGLSGYIERIEAEPPRRLPDYIVEVALAQSQADYDAKLAAEPSGAADGPTFEHSDEDPDDMDGEPDQCGLVQHGFGDVCVLPPGHEGPHRSATFGTKEIALDEIGVYATQVAEAVSRHVLFDVRSVVASVPRPRLPVVKTCGACAHMGHTSGDRETCDHVDAPVQPTGSYPIQDSLAIVRQTEAPPAWCPLRGGA